LKQKIIDLKPPHTSKIQTEHNYPQLIDSLRNAAILMFSAVWRLLTEHRGVIGAFFVVFPVEIHK